MGILMKYSVLVVFSCPGDQPRLRLDKEHRFFQQIIDEKKVHEKVKIMQAATISDLVDGLSSPYLQVLHFSGHGSQNAIYLEKTENSDQGNELNSDILSKLIQEHCPALETLILASCYSAASIDLLKNSASKVITVEGEAGDHAAIEFSKHFYTSYFNGISIDKSILRTQLYLQANNLDEQFQVLVTRQDDKTSNSKPYLQAVKNKITEEATLIDVSEIETYFERLIVPRKEFLSLLITKMRIHQWLVYQNTNMDHAILSFGKYHAVFSWEAGMNIIKCKKIIRLRESVSDKQADAWLGLAARYNQLYSLPYRMSSNNRQRKLNNHQIRPFKITVEKYFSEMTREATAIRKTIPEEMKMFAPTVIHNFNLGLEEFSEGNFSQAIIHFETALSAIHSVLELLTETFSE